MHPLLRQIRSVASRARGLVLVFAGARVLTIGVFSIVIACWMDYWLRYEEVLPRFFALAAVTLLVAWGCRRWLLPAFAFRLGGVETAQRIERFYPALRGHLSSAVEFLESPTSSGSSNKLQRQAIVAAEDAAQRLNLHACLETRPTIRAVAGMLTAAILVAIIVFSDPSSALRAAQRLALPWTDNAWPRRHQLELVNPQNHLAVGQDYQVEVADRNGRLPESVTLQWRTEGSQEVRSRVVKPINNRAIDRWESMQQSFQVRAFGGDDDTMDWHTVHVRPAPRLVDLQMELVAPSYTGLPRTSVSQSFRALAGSQILVQGVADRPLHAVRLKTDTMQQSVTPLELSDVVSDVEESVDREGPDSADSDASPSPTVGHSDGSVGSNESGRNRSFAIRSMTPWILEKSGRYSLELEDLEGIRADVNGTGEIQVLEDEPPQLSWEETRPTLTVTPLGILHLKGMVQDDLAIQSIELHILQSASADGEPTPVIVPLHQGPQHPSPPQFPRADGGDVVNIDHQLAIDRAGDLKPGDLLEAKIVATDYKPNVSESISIRISIVSPETLTAKFLQTQSGLLAKLEEAIRLQRDTSSRTATLLPATDSPQAIADRLKSVQHQQRRVQQLLLDDADSVQQQTVTLLDQMTDNRLEKNSNFARLRAVHETLTLLERSAFPIVEQKLAAGLRELSTANPQPSTWQTELEAAQDKQREALKFLEAILNQLTDWETLQRLASDANQLQEMQEEIEAASAERLESENAFQDVENLAPSERESLRELARQQFDNRSALEHLLERIRQALPQQVTQDPAAAQSLREALELAEEHQLLNEMTVSGESLQDNRLGEALTRHSKIKSALRNLSLALSQQPERDLARVTQSMRASADALAKLQPQQDRLRDQFQQLRDNSGAVNDQHNAEAFAEAQANIVQQIEQLQQQLTRMPAQRTSKQLRDASQRGHRASQAAAEGSIEQAADQAALASNSLNEAERRLREELNAANQLLLEQRLFNLKQYVAEWQAELQRLRDQTTLMKETSALESSGAAVADLEYAQRQLAKDVNGQAESEFAEQDFSVALRSVFTSLDAAADEIAQANWDRADGLQQKAMSHLQMLADSLREDHSSETDEAPPSDSDTPPGQDPNPPQVHSLAELRLLHRWQLDIQRRTTELHELQQQTGVLTAEHTRELEALADEQGRLAAFLHTMTITPLSNESSDEHSPE